MRQGRGPITSGRSQYFALAGFLAAWLLIIWFVDGGGFQSYYLENWVGPRLQKDLGFEVGPSPIEGEKLSVVASVLPGGVMARAGVRAGETACAELDSPGGITRLYASLRRLEQSSAVEVCLMMVGEQGNIQRRQVVIRR